MTASRFKEILDTVRNQKDLQPSGGETHCNEALDRILLLCGIPRFLTSKGEPLLANDIIDAIENSPNWTKVDGDIACARASKGIVVVACQCAEMHGHVCVTYPLPMQMSGSWKKQVPVLNNIGKTVGVMKASLCFRTEPDYYSVKI